MKNMKYLSFCVWPVLLNIRSTEYIHVVTSGRISFLRLNNIPLYLYVYITFYLSTYKSTDTGYFQILATVKNAQWKRECRSLLEILNLLSLAAYPEVNCSIFSSGVSQLALVVKNLPANAGDIRGVALIPGLGQSPGGEHGNPLQYSCLDNPTGRGAWWATVHGVAQSWTWLRWLSTYASSIL